MDAINAVASLLNRSIDVGTAYFKENAIAIGILLAAVYYFRTRYPNGRPSQGYVLSSSSSSDRSGEQGQKGLSSTTNTNKNNHISHQEDMRQVRQRQQEIADERAKEAASKRKEKEVEEKERKNHVAKNKPATNGNRLGDGRNPATSNTSSYRPASRNSRS